MQQLESVLSIFVSCFPWAFLPTPSPSHSSDLLRGWTPCAIKPLPTSCLFHTWWCVYVDATLWIYPTLSFPHCVHKPILYIHISIPALQIGSLYHFSRFHISALIYDICFSLSDFTMCNRFYVHPPHYNWLTFIPLYGWAIFHCIYVPQLLYPFIGWWTSRLLPRPGYFLSIES